MKNAVQMPITGAARFVTPEELKPVLFPPAEERQRQQDVLRAREFHEGRQNAKLTERLKQFICDGDDDDDFSLNLAASIVNAVAERLLLDVDSPMLVGEDAPETEKQKHEQWVTNVWRGSRFAWKQADIHEAAVRDGEYFVIVDWDNENARPRFTPHQRYTDPDTRRGTVSGDGEGVALFYPNNNSDAKPLFAVQRWAEVLPNGKTEKRIAMYYPDQIVTYQRTALGWHALNKVSWVHPVTNEPLGIPVVAFRNPNRRPEAKRAWPMLRVVNYLLLTLLQTCDTAAFRIWLFAGWEPIDSDGKPLTIAPNRWIGSADVDKDKFHAEAVEGADPAPLGEQLEGMIFKVGAITDTPASRLLVTRQVAAEGTLKQQNDPLIAKVRRRAGNFGSAYEDLFSIARRLENAFGSQQLDESVLLTASWEPFETRGADEKLLELEIEEKEVQIQILKGQRGISKKQSQRELRYSPEQILKMALEAEDEQINAGSAFGSLFNRGPV